MEKFRKNKLGEMVSSQLVTIILLVVGFAILILVFANVGWTEEIDRETCHASVILRATLPDTFDLKDITPLKCQTKKFCITDKTFGKGECEYEKGFEKGEYETIRVSKIGKDKTKTEEEINRFIARELASCWAMMGEGKVQIFTREVTTEKRCSVCSRIAFDKSLKDELKEGVKGLGDYLLTREVPNQGVSYWKFLTNNAEEKIPDYNKFSTNEKVIVFIEIGNTKISNLLGAGVGGAVGIAFAIIFPPAGIAIGTLSFVTGVIMGEHYGEKVGDKMMERKFHTGWSFVDYNSETLKDLECSSFESIG